MTEDAGFRASGGLLMSSIVRRLSAIAAPSRLGRLGFGLRAKLDTFNEKFAYGTLYMQTEIEVQPRLMIAAPATAPIRPMSPRVGRNIAVGIPSGLILVGWPSRLGRCFVPTE
jgi:hypothetical protein